MSNRTTKGKGHQCTRESAAKAELEGEQCDWQDKQDFACVGDVCPALTQNEDTDEQN